MSTVQTQTVLLNINQIKKKVKSINRVNLRSSTQIDSNFGTIEASCHHLSDWIFKYITGESRVLLDPRHYSSSQVRRVKRLESYILLVKLVTYGFSLIFYQGLRI